jgi:hypothetical protein
VTNATDAATGASKPLDDASEPHETGLAGSRGPIGWSVLAGLIAVALAAPMLRAPLSIFDGGIAASAGTFILHGRIPYRDFWLLYGPLTAYLAAALTAIFGTDLIVLRTAGLVMVGLTALLGYWLVRDRAPGLPGVVLAAVAAGIGVRWTGVDLWPWAVAMILVFGALLVARGGSNRQLVAAGLLLGLSVLTRQDLGAYAVIAVCVSTRSLRPVVGAAIVLIPAGVLLIVAVPIQALVEQLVWYPLVGPREFRGLPGPGLTTVLDPGATLDWILYWPPLAILALAIARLWQRRSMPPTYLALLILGLLCRLQTLGRADGEHTAEAIVPVILLLAVVVDRPRSFPARMALSTGVALMIAISALPITTLGHAPEPYDTALDAAVSLVRSETGANEPIFVGEAENRFALFNPLIAYYLADRPPGVRDTMYNPGITNTAATQARMVADLAANHVRYLILDVRFADCFEPANESRIPGPTILDDAIRRDYSVVANFGAVEIMSLNGTVGTRSVPQLWVDPDPPIGGGMTCSAPSTP